MIKLVEEILKNGKTKSWLQYAELFNIKPGEPNLKRAKAANDIWRNYIKRSGKPVKLEIKKVTIKENNTWETYVNNPSQPPVDVQNLKLSKVWVTPEGRIGRTYINPDEYGIDDKVFQKLCDEILTTTTVAIPKTPDSQYGKAAAVYISDLHIGAIVKALDEVVHTQEFNLDVINSYLEEIIFEVNSRNFDRVHLFIPGDIVESFTGMNHPDTWKKIQSYQGELIITAFTVLKRFLLKIDNLERVYMVEGNHDRITALKESNTRKGLVQVLSFFLSQAGFDIEYQPLMVGAEIGGIYHIITHGDTNNTADYDKFLFKNGKQGIFNLIVSGHKHKFTVLKNDKTFMHVVCPSLFTGSFYSEAYNSNTLPAFLIVEDRNGKPQINYIPLTGN